MAKNKPDEGGAEHLQAGVDKLNMTESHLRSLAKGIGWRAVATLTTMVLVLIFTRKLTLCLEIGALEVLAKLGLYYLYERAWNMVDWGRPVAELGGK
ncbi:MAG: DUF2061 domain-containing protein [Planctomycetota bacterium]|jgi:uncharacterized membrane protein